MSRIANPTPSFTGAGVGIQDLRLRVGSSPQRSSAFEDLSRVLLAGVQTAGNVANLSNQQRQEAEYEQRQRDAAERQSRLEAERQDNLDEATAVEGYEKQIAESRRVAQETGSIGELEATLVRHTESQIPRIAIDANNELTRLRGTRQQNAEQEAATINRERLQAASELSTHASTIVKDLSVSLDAPNAPALADDIDYGSRQNFYLSMMRAVVQQQAPGPIDPDLDKMLDRRASLLAAERTRIVAERTATQNRESIDSLATTLAFDVDDTAASRMETFDRQAKMVSKPEDLQQHQAKMVDKMISSIEATYSADRSSISALKSLTEVEDAVRSMGWSKQNIDSINDARSKVLVGAQSQILGKMYTPQVSGSASGSHAAALMAIDPSTGVYRIEPLLLKVLRDNDVPIDPSAKSLSDVPEPADFAQRQVYAMVQGVWSQAFADAKRTPGYKSDGQIGSDALRQYQRGGQLMTATELNEAWSLMPVKTLLSSGVEATSEQISEAALQSTNMVRINGIAPPAMMTDLSRLLKSTNEQDLTLARDLIAGLGGVNSSFFLNALSDLKPYEQQEMISLGASLMSYSTGNEFQRRFTSTSWFGDYSTQRNAILQVGVPSDQNAQKAMGLDSKTFSKSLTSVMEDTLGLDDIEGLALNATTTDTIKSLSASYMIRAGKSDEDTQRQAQAFALNTLRANGVAFIKTGDLVRQIDDPHRHYQTDREASESILSEMTRVVPGGTNPSSEFQQIRAYFGVPEDLDTRGWSVFEYVKYGMQDRLGSASLRDLSFSVDWNDPAYMAQDRTATSGVRNLGHMWLAGGGVVHIKIGDTDLGPIRGSGPAMGDEYVWTWSGKNARKADSTRGVFKAVYEIDRPKTKPESERTPQPKSAPYPFEDL